MGVGHNKPYNRTMNSRMLRFGIDARPLQGETQFRGIGIALAHLIESLEKHGSTYRFIYYIDAKLPLPKILHGVDENRIIKTTSSALGRKKYFRSVLKSFSPIKPNSKDIDVFFQYDASLGVPGSISSVVVFHDLIPLLFRENEKHKARHGSHKVKDQVANELYWRKFKSDLRQYKNANKIIAISEASRQDFIKHVDPMKAKNVFVVHHGVEQPENLNAIKPSERFKTLDKYLLFVGGIDYRKNLQRLLKDFYSLKPQHPSLKLVLVGKEFALKTQLENLGWSKIISQNPEWEKDIIMPGFVSFEEREWLYKNARVFVFPSLYEGFGLPVLEAMAMGCPVVAYSNSSIPEVAGNAALLAKDGAPMVNEINSLLADEKLRNKLSKSGHEQAKKFTWDRAAEKIIKILESAASDY